MYPTTLLRSAFAALCAVCFCAFSTALLQAEGPPATRPAGDVVRGVDDQEQDEVLLGKRTDDLLSRVQGRMDESSTRLTRETDAGLRTQEVQRRILDDLDQLIEAAKKQKKACKTCIGVGPSEAKPADGQQKVGQSRANDAATAAASSDKPSAAAAAKLPPSEFVERREAFMRVSPRLIPSVIEGATEQVSEKYRGMTQDYYKAVARAQK